MKATIKQVTQEEEDLYKILIIGDSHVGKSSLLLRFADNSFEDTYLSTIGVDFRIKRVLLEDTQTNKQVSVKLQIWDTAGQERFQTITRSYYRKAHGIIIVYDITSKASFDSVESWLLEINSLNNDTVCKLLVGNKADLSNQRAVAKPAAQALAGKLGLLFVETSAKYASMFPSINQMFNMMARCIYQQQRTKDQTETHTKSYTKDSADQSAKSNQTKQLVQFNKKPAQSCC
jgi:Ras-related protein Rab-1A